MTTRRNPTPLTRQRSNRGGAKRKCALPKIPTPAENLAELEALAEAQGIKPIVEPLAMKADFWPADESVDEFVQAIRALRHHGK